MTKIYQLPSHRTSLNSIPIRKRVGRCKGKLKIILERDHGICQLCGLKVRTDLQAPENASPSVDHIVPLSRGGTNAIKNLQLAHFWCNVRKGNRYIRTAYSAEQMEGLKAMLAEVRFA